MHTRFGAGATLFQPALVQNTVLDLEVPQNVDDPPPSIANALQDAWVNSLTLYCAVAAFVTWSVSCCCDHYITVAALNCYRPPALGKHAYWHFKIGLIADYLTSKIHKRP